MEFMPEHAPLAVMAFLGTAGLLALVALVLLLALGERKYFCEIDCHIAYSVSGVEETAMLGDELHQTAATGRFVIVHLKTWFDPSTISPHRGNGELSPGLRRIVLVDRHGTEFPPSASAQQLLAKLHGASTPITQPLRPGES